MPAWAPDGPVSFVPRRPVRVLSSVRLTEAGSGSDHRGNQIQHRGSPTSLTPDERKRSRAGFPELVLRRAASCRTPPRQSVGRPEWTAPAPRGRLNNSGSPGAVGQQGRILVPADGSRFSNETGLKTIMQALSPIQNLRKKALAVIAGFTGGNVQGGRHGAARRFAVCLFASFVGSQRPLQRFDPALVGTAGRAAALPSRSVRTPA